MKKTFLILLSIISFNAYSQTGINSSDGVLTVEVPTHIDVLEGYPSGDELNPEAIEYYRKGTESIFDNPKKAIDYLIKAINYDPKFVQAYDNLGKVYRGLEKYDLAIKSYNISLKIFPSGSVAHQNLAVVYSKQNMWTKAIEEYKILVKLKPQDPEGYYGLAIHYRNEDDLNLALSNALKALMLYKKNPPNYIGDGYALIGLIYYDLGDKAQAKTYIQIAKEKYISNNLEYVYNNTFSSNILKELSIE